MSETVYLTTICLVLGTILAVYGMRWLSAMQYAKVRVAAETAAAGSTTTLASIQAGVEEIKVRLGAIEKVLKDVE